MTGRVSMDKYNTALTSVPASVTGMVLFGVALSDWVLVATLIWLGMQMSTHAYSRWYKPWRERKKNASS